MTLTNRLLPLDVLRGVAVLLVIWHHADGDWLFSLPVPTGLSKAIQRGGWIGVDLFFVLSGFLIGGLLFREHKRHGRIHLGRFLVRRGLKIYPAFYVFLITTLIVAHARDGAVPDRAWAEALLVQNYVGGVWGHTWSLAIEEHFYVLLPLFLAGLIRWHGAKGDEFSVIPVVCFVMGGLVLVGRFLTVPREPFNTLTHLYPSHLRIDSLMFGVLLAYLFTYRATTFERIFATRFWWCVAIGAALCLPAFFFPLQTSPYLYTLGFTQLYLGCGLIVSAVVVRGLPLNRLTRMVGVIGTYSYSIYLWHLMMKRWGVDVVRDMAGRPLPPEAEFLAYALGSLGLGILMSRLVEYPVLRLRDRFFPSRSGTVVAPASAS